MNLYQASRWFFERSEACLTRGLWLSAVILVLTISTFAQLQEVPDTLLIVAIAFLQLVQMWLKYKSLYWFSKGDEPRRMDQLRSGLGIQPSEEKIGEIEQIAGQCNDPVDDKYWLSHQPVGPRRMVEMLLESSFYTRYLALRCKELFWMLGVGGSAVSLVALIVAYRLRSSRPSELVSHVVITVLVFFLSGDFWTFGLLYRDLSLAADEAHKQAFRLLKQADISFLDALEVAISYNTTVAQAPPLLASKHLKSRTELDQLFKRAYGSLLGL